jgi:bisphosphoglycerate-dependent phosphoglycerate mutase
MESQTPLSLSHSDIPVFLATTSTYTRLARQMFRAELEAYDQLPIRMAKNWKVIERHPWKIAGAGAETVFSNCLLHE